MMLVVAKHLYSEGGSFRLCKVNISAMPSRFRPLPGWTLSMPRASGSGLALLLLRQLVQHIAQRVVPTPLDGLFGAEHLFDSGAQRLGAINDEQVLAIGGQALIAQVRQQTLDRGGIFGRSRFDP